MNPRKDTMMTGENDELPPCPFCGGNGYANTITYSKPPYANDGLKGQLVYYHVTCGRCGAALGGRGGYPTAQEAIDAWSMRAPAPADRWREGFLAGREAAADLILEHCRAANASRRSARFSDVVPAIRKIAPPSDDAPHGEGEE